MKFINIIALLCCLFISATAKADDEPEPYVIDMHVYYMGAGAKQTVKVDGTKELYGPFLCWWGTSRNSSGNAIGAEVFCVYRNNITTMFSTSAKCNKYKPGDRSSSHINLYAYNERMRHKLVGQFFVFCNTTSQKKFAPNPDLGE